MTVKRRIMLLVAGAGFVASLLFSVVVFYELIEQPFDLLDMELEEEVNRVIKIIEMKHNGLESSISDSLAPERFSFWLKIYEQGTERTVYQSELARQIDLPSVEPGSNAIADAIIQDENINLGQGNSKKITFRIRASKSTIYGNKLRIQIGLPIVKLKEEIQELILGLVAGLIFSSLALVVISYFVAGKILKPIGTMKDLAQNISEKNLDQRIPVEKGSDEFNELARTINGMLDRLQFSFMRQRDFLFDTSHELKTPLTTIRLAIDEIRSSDGIESYKNSSKENLLRLNEQVLRMERLVKDLLNLSALEILTSIDFKPVHLTETLSSLIEDYQFLAEGKNIHIEDHIPSQLVILGDKEKLKRLFSNILDNAIKYNMDGGRIKLTTRYSGVELSITIANTGPGVAEAEIPKVFDQFYRVEKSRSIKHGGSGLGLAIVKRIVELHGGNVKLESEKGSWTKVTVTLPRLQDKIMV